VSNACSWQRNDQHTVQYLEQSLTNHTTQNHKLPWGTNRDQLFHQRPSKLSYRYRWATSSVILYLSIIYLSISLISNHRLPVSSPRDQLRQLNHVPVSTLQSSRQDVKVITRQADRSCLQNWQRKRQLCSRNLQQTMPNLGRGSSHSSPHVHLAPGRAPRL
jgi:hypothetical protein